MRFSIIPAFLLTILGTIRGNPDDQFESILSVPNEGTSNCVSFTVSSGTGCAWMCNYCANQLGTNNYYFTDGVCKYQDGVGCVGNPQLGITYTCCKA
jgi:hypothetical protein